MALLAPPALEVVSLSRLVPFLSKASGSPQPVDAQALAAWVDRILGHLPWPWRRTCLRRAVVLFALFRGAGWPVELWIGVRRNENAPDDEGVHAHAWLTKGGAPYLEVNPDHPGLHTPIARFPAAR